MQKEAKFKESQVNILHYVAYSLLIAALGIVGYLYVDLNSQSSQDRNNAKKVVSFAELPLDVQKEYKSINEYKSLEMKLKNIQEQNKRLTTINRDVSPAPLVKSSADKNFEDLSEAPKGAKLIKEFASCYDMEMGSYIISWECKKNIISFINKHKDAKYFEIIPLVDDAEFTLYKNLENNDFIYDKLNVTQNSINKMKKLSQSGLAKHRAVEANWVIKVHTNKKAKVYSANYHLISHDGKRGILVRAYH
ncbi:hypothetical protein M947_06945 [Sulfurimonas hongkongensis]|uniref:Uncharacterized protein n=1 Tax=Sulfurimonas hongkongensis TaxID=1172190 RepID=T0JEE3_9BACT|nr:hypothetical protein [Sulfurimonas hongkongensis]EQB39390.1 hypothetical protein M947_06945 [Sulfurimonas hongkongensis]